MIRSSSQSQPSPPTQLDTHESESHFTDQSQTGVCDLTQESESVSFRHSGWRTKRSKMIQAIQSACVGPDRIERMQQCGSNAWVLKARGTVGIYKISCDKCRDRLCTPCAREKGLIIAQNLRPKMIPGRTRFVTLTLKDSSASLSSEITRLYDAWSKLRRTKAWSTTQIGGASFLEIKYSQKRSGWHPHLHIVTEGSYLDKMELSKSWLRATRDSYIIDIRRITSVDKAASYVTKYLAKGISAKTIIDSDRGAEAVQALVGRKLISTWGTWRGTNLTTISSDEIWFPIGKLSTVIALAAADDREMMQALACLRRDSWGTSPRSEDVQCGP